MEIELQGENIGIQSNRLIRDVGKGIINGKITPMNSKSQAGLKIKGFLVQYDRNRLMNVYKDSKDPAIQKDIANHHQVRLAIPRGYNMDFIFE